MLPGEYRGPTPAKFSIGPIDGAVSMSENREQLSTRLIESHKWDRQRGRERGATKRKRRARAITGENRLVERAAGTTDCSRIRGSPLVAVVEPVDLWEFDHITHRCRLDGSLRLSVLCQLEMRARLAVIAK